MARRYADGTSSTAVFTVNECVRKVEELGIPLAPDSVLADPAGRLATEGGAVVR
ncbi:MAG: hypothetical protein JWM27_3105 [Gemmatimonadetes bacterium]|nr:hypothetical protein [Gemmatimonadota bacterium]